MDFAFFKQLVADSRFYEAAVLLRAAAVPLRPDEVVENSGSVAALTKLAMEGGTIGADAVGESFARAANADGPWSITQVITGMHAASCRRFMRALSTHTLHATTEPFGIMCALPSLDTKQRVITVQCFRAALDRAAGKQAIVVERISTLLIRDIVRLPERHTIAATIGTTAPLDILSDFLRIAAGADAYPGLGDALLHETLCRAQWPLVACLARDLEVIYQPTLTQWLLEPARRAGFTETASNWMRIATCFSAEDFAGEPPDSFEPE